MSKPSCSLEAQILTPVNRCVSLESEPFKECSIFLIHIIQGEEEHSESKSRYGRTNRNQAEGQIAQLERRQNLIRKLVHDLDRSALNEDEQSASGAENPSADPFDRYRIAKDQKKWTDFGQFLTEESPGDPALDVSPFAL
jgi:hypothetical protein